MVYPERTSEQQKIMDSPSGQKGNKMNDRTAATAARFGLTRTPDAIENYGEHLYFVFHHDSTWEHPVTEQHD